MKICAECFEDIELKGFIISMNQKGSCQTCGCIESYVIDIVETFDFFKSLLSNFKLDKQHSKKSLVTRIQDHWNFFKNADVGNKIITEVVNNNDIPKDILITPVNFNDDILYSVNYWDTLKEQLKWENRYFTDIGHLMTGEPGWDGLFFDELVIRSEDIFYRGRIQNSANADAFKTHEMFSPDKLYASAGRANPQGIPYLYLCDNVKTVPYEIRAAYLDEISIGTFRLKSSLNKDIRVSDFTEKAGLFSTDTSYDVINKRIRSALLKDKISSDLSKPIRRYDSELDYIPTQFICELLKNIPSFEGIKFKSSLHNDGNNYVFFDQSIFECTNVESHKVQKIEIATEEINLLNSSNTGTMRPK